LTNTINDPEYQVRIKSKLCKNPRD